MNEAIDFGLVFLNSFMETFNLSSSGHKTTV